MAQRYDKKCTYASKARKYYKKIIDFNLFGHLLPHYRSLLMIVRVKEDNKGEAYFLIIFRANWSMSYHQGSRKARGFVGRGAIEVIFNLRANSYDKRIATTRT